MRKIFVFVFSLCLADGLLAQDSLPLMMTKGKLPFLEYGIGDDRLGGAKMGYLDSGVLLSVLDSFGTDYKVRLSSHHAAYVAKESVFLFGKSPRQLPAHNANLSGNIKVFGDDHFDYVTFSLPAAVPYRSYLLLNPGRIVIDLFGITTNTNWITQLRSALEVKNTWTDPVEDDLLRVYVELKHPQPWGYGLSYDSAHRKLTLRVKRQPAVLDFRRIKLAIDAGHGGDNSGTSGVRSGELEKNLTLIYARELEKAFRKAGGQKVFMTRTKDTSLSMPERIEMLRQADPDLLVSIHFNSANSDSVRGVSTYYRYVGFRPLSQSLLRSMLTLGLEEYGNIGNFNFALSSPTEYPNALVEVAFLSSPLDEKRILNPRFQKAVAQKILAGIQQWLSSCK